MNTELNVRVWRRQDNVAEGLSDDSPRALELHQMRSQALHEVLDNVDGLEVKDWGDTDDEKTHEVVEIILAVGNWVTQPEHLQVMSAAAIAIGKTLGSAAVTAGVKEGAQWLFDRLRKKQKDNQIETVLISPTPMINIQIDPPRYGGRVSVTVQVEGEPWPR